MKGMEREVGVILKALVGILGLRVAVRATKCDMWCVEAPHDILAVVTAISVSSIPVPCLPSLAIIITAK